MRTGMYGASLCEARVFSTDGILITPARLDPVHDVRPIRDLIPCRIDPQCAHSGGDANVLDSMPVWMAEFKRTNTFDVRQRNTDPMMFDMSSHGTPSFSSPPRQFVNIA